jgi:hypothetical protein
MASGQKSRKSKTSKEERRSSQRVVLTDVQKVLLGGGMFHFARQTKPRRMKQHRDGD